ncbi:hypothetical protein ACFSR7_35770 [Cohnella sp. GCM10020058]|uniref:hypothetical protein n=1 Tax=Cohnella sp. GCM10020058 TaxID=3317330 RepID=UPI003627ADEC
MLYGLKLRLKELYKCRTTLAKTNASVDVFIGNTPIGIPVSVVLEEVEKEIEAYERIIKEAEGE